MDATRCAIRGLKRASIKPVQRTIPRGAGSGELWVLPVGKPYWLLAEIGLPVVEPAFCQSVESKALSHLFQYRVTDDLTNVTTSTYTVLDSDNLITLNRAAGIAVTLPAATGSGRKIKFVVGTSITSNTTTRRVRARTDAGLCAGVSG